MLLLTQHGSLLWLGSEFRVCIGYMSTATKNNTGIALKGGLFTLTSIQFLTNNMEEIAFHLDEKIKQAPKFFQYAPIILDVQFLQQDKQVIDFQSLCDVLKNKQLIPIGVRGANALYKEAAMQMGLAIFPEDKIMPKKRATDPSQHENLTIEPVTVQTEPLSGTSTRVIVQPVRSGQQIYAPGGDLIILASVGHGAEVLADGHIHVYGPLRGRALAGVMGNPDAMIFCKSLEAELVSVAGQYRMSEDLKETFWKNAVCVQLQEERLNIRLI